MKINGKSVELAKPGDPYARHNGEVLEPEEDQSVEVRSMNMPLPSTPVPYEFYRPDSRRVLSEYRESKSLTNACAVVFSYTVLGIGDAEICDATGLDAKQLADVRGARCYGEMFEGIMRGLINANSEYVEARISSYSGMALNNIADIAQTAKNKGVKLSASKDLLDRAGHRPQDQASKGNSGMNELHIIVTSAKEDDVAIEFNLNKKELEHGDSP